MVAGGLIALSIFLFQIFPGLIIIPAPFLIFFLVLALPLKKEQPMEVYLAAILSFHLRPQKRLWESDGIEHLIEISAPMNTDEHLTKDIARDEASRRLSYLADIVDTEGWAIKHAVSQDSNIQQDVLAEGRAANDIFENRANQIDSLLASQNNLRKQQIMRNLNTARNLADYTNSSAEQIQAQTFATPNSTDLYADYLERAKIQQQNFQQAQNIQPTRQYQINPQSYSSMSQPVIQNEPEEIKLQYNPYPNSMHQAVISPNGAQPIQSPQPAPAPQPIQQPTEPVQVKPEIAKLVSEGTGLSVETLARQAEKINKREAEIDLNNEEEVVISLR